MALTALCSQSARIAELQRFGPALCPLIGRVARLHFERPLRQSLANLGQQLDKQLRHNQAENIKSRNEAAAQFMDMVNKLEGQLVRREDAVARQEQDLVRRLREVAAQEEDLRDRLDLLRQAGPGDIVESFWPGDHADILWRLTKDDINRANGFYPLESLWCTRGRLRCRLIVHSQGPYVRVSLAPSSLPGAELRAFGLRCTLTLAGSEIHPGDADPPEPARALIDRLSLSVSDRDWHRQGLVVDATRCPEQMWVELRIHKFVALLSEDKVHIAGQESSATELVPTRARFVLGRQRPHAADQLLLPR